MQPRSHRPSIGAKQSFTETRHVTINWTRRNKSAKHDWRICADAKDTLNNLLMVHDRSSSNCQHIFYDLLFGICQISTIYPNILCSRIILVNKPLRSHFESSSSSYNVFRVSTRNLTRLVKQEEIFNLTVSVAQQLDKGFTSVLQKPQGTRWGWRGIGHMNEW